MSRLIQYLKELMNVKMLSPAKSKIQNILFVDTSQFSFETTPFGEKEGFSDKDLKHMIDLWLEFGRVQAVFSFYSKYFFLIFSSYFLVLFSLLLFLSPIEMINLPSFF